MAVRLDGLKARRILGSLSVTRLAQLATVSEWTITQLENVGVVGGVGGSCDVVAAARILDALAPPVSIATNSQQNPTVLTITAGHTFQTGDTVMIAGNTGSNADINGTRVVTRINGTTFSVPVNCATAGGAGGTAVATLASVGVSQL